ncbi:hypothetical protein RJ639_041350 [Escallonia herrerae]|uniref:Uncharacterized protein n=1 Tax=Escallonia herrerae TaxID=1293975 RepID=A0AA88WFJ2_9ASTE|nr:hypothetical protein RJ639_041350 [Escallonia herrerae]
MLEAILDLARQLTSSRKLPQPEERDDSFQFLYLKNETTQMADEANQAMTSSMAETAVGATSSSLHPKLNKKRPARHQHYEKGDDGSKKSASQISKDNVVESEEEESLVEWNGDSVALFSPEMLKI